MFVVRSRTHRHQPGTDMEAGHRKAQPRLFVRFSTDVLYSIIVPRCKGILYNPCGQDSVCIFMLNSMATRPTHVQAAYMIQIAGHAIARDRALRAGGHY